MHGADCKIPDATGEETGTVQILTRDVCQTSASGTTVGLQILCPYINLGATGNVSGINYQKTLAASTLLALQWGNGNATAGYGAGFEFPGAADIRAITNAHRIVSACLIVEHEASALNNQGEMTLFCIPFGDSVGTGAYSVYQNLYSSITIPLNVNKPGIIRWFPLQREIADSTYGTPFSYKDFACTTDEVLSIGNPPTWTLGFLTSGVANGVTFKCTMCVNYEFIPLTNTLNILSASPSPVDEEEEGLVVGWVESAPAARILSEGAANSSPSSVSPQHGDEPTGFGMLANVVKEILPFAAMLL